MRVKLRSIWPSKIVGYRTYSFWQPVKYFRWPNHSLCIRNTPSEFAGGVTSIAQRTRWLVETARVVRNIPPNCSAMTGMSTAIGESSTTIAPGRSADWRVSASRDWRGVVLAASRSGSAQAAELFASVRTTVADEAFRVLVSHRSRQRSRMAFFWQQSCTCTELLRITGITAETESWIVGRGLR